MPWQSGRVAMPLDRSRDSLVPLFFILGRGVDFPYTNEHYIYRPERESKPHPYASFSTYLPRRGDLCARTGTARFAEKRETV